MRRVILAIITTAVALVLLLSFKTQTQSAAPISPPPAVVGSPSPGSPSPGSRSPGGTGSPSPASPTKSSPAAAGVTRALTGKAVQTSYGPVQVKIVVTDGRITAATALQYPQGTSYGAQINSSAIPQLNRAAVAAGSAKIDAVSGATYTSGGYIASLQSALDQLA